MSKCKSGVCSAGNSEFHPKSGEGLLSRSISHAAGNLTPNSARCNEKMPVEKEP
jgi:hypothetical protein